MTPVKNQRKNSDDKSIEPIVLTVELPKILKSDKQKVGITRGGGLEHDFSLTLLDAMLILGMLKSGIILSAYYISIAISKKVDPRDPKQSISWYRIDRSVKIKSGEFSLRLMNGGGSRGRCCRILKIDGNKFSNIRNLRSNFVRRKSSCESNFHDFLVLEVDFPLIKEYFAIHTHCLEVYNPSGFVILIVILHWRSFTHCLDIFSIDYSFLICPNSYI